MGKHSSLTDIPSATWNHNSDDELCDETYDQDGNVTAVNGKTFCDSPNELLSMNGAAVRIIYDGDGNRVAKTTSSGTTRYLVDDLNPTGLPQIVEELNGAVTRAYTYELSNLELSHSRAHPIELSRGLLKKFSQVTEKPRQDFPPYLPIYSPCSLPLNYA